MPVLIVGATHIPYRVRRSERARRQSIIVTPDKVEVVAPENTSQDAIAEFVYSRRRWVYDNLQRMRERLCEPAPAPRFVSGAKVLYRGRMLRLRVTTGRTAEATIQYRNGFHATLPARLPSKHRDAVIQQALADWMKERLASDVASVLTRHSRYLEIPVPRFRIKAQKHLWGSCGKDQVLNFNWHLILVPRPVLEYVVVHELCHLKCRNHSPRFWMHVRSLLPDFQTQKALLEDCDSSVLKSLTLSVTDR